MLASLLLLHSLSAAVAADPPVRVWFNSDGHYEFGDRAKVCAQTADDGYLVVLRADAQGHVRVLFPIDPDGNQQIRGGKKDELKGRGGREAFVVDDTTGHGTVLAALAKTPFQFEEFAKNGRWDYSALDDSTVRADPAAGLLDLVQRMRGAGDHFDYDVASYTVGRSEEHTSELQSQSNLVCRLLLEKKKMEVSWSTPSSTSIQQQPCPVYFAVRR